MLNALIGPVADILDKFVEDKDQKNRLAHEIATMAEKQAHESAMAQIMVNREEAKSKSVFVSGWRPFTGWVTAFALAYHFCLVPIILFGVALFGIEIPELPSFDLDSLMTVLLGMLGLGGLRSYEKMKGVANK